MAAVRGRTLRPLCAPAVGRRCSRTKRCGTDEHDARDDGSARPNSTSAARCPSGVTVLEASAGTGKTYTIAALAARYVADGHAARADAADHVHADGDGRAARPRARAARDAARSSSRGCSTACLTRAPTRSSSCSRPARRRRSSCDAIGSCARSPTSTLRRSRRPTGSARRCSPSSGRSATSSPGTEFVEDVSELIEEVLDDLYVRRFQKHGGAPFDRAEALKIARAAVENPGNELEPQDAPQDSVAAMRYRLAQAVRDELEHRKRADGDHDLRRSAHAAERDARARAERPGGGGAAALALQGRARRRVPGHRPDPVADPQPGVRVTRA